MAGDYELEFGGAAFKAEKTVHGGALAGWGLGITAVGQGWLVKVCGWVDCVEFDGLQAR